MIIPFSVHSYIATIPFTFICFNFHTTSTQFTFIQLVPFCFNMYIQPIYKLSLIFVLISIPRLLCLYIRHIYNIKYVQNMQAKDMVGLALTYWKTLLLLYICDESDKHLFALLLSIAFFCYSLSVWLELSLFTTGWTHLPCFIGPKYY